VRRNDDAVESRPLAKGSALIWIFKLGHHRNMLHVDAPMFFEGQYAHNWTVGATCLPPSCALQPWACAIFREVREDDFLHSHDGGFQ
jgi:hypothetical protein